MTEAMAALCEKMRRCRDEIRSCHENQQTAETQAVALGAMQGELDWRSELALLEAERAKLEQSGGIER